MHASKNGYVPKWFQRAIATPARDGFVEVAGCRIHYLRWHEPGKPGKPGLLLVHGGFAHAHWWDFIAPSFVRDYSVAAIDLSGMGESGRRPRYTRELFAKEVMSVCAHAELGDRPIIVGHSFGGFVALVAAIHYGTKLGGAVMADFPIRPPELQKEHQATRPWVKPKETYPTMQAALKRFRLIPPQPCANEFILQHIARRSLAKVNGGWSWKFDDRLFDRFELGNLSEEIARVACPLTLIYGEKSALFPAEVIRYMKRSFNRTFPMIKIPGAHHHLFLEKPFVFVRTVRRVIARWQKAGVESNRR